MENIETVIESFLVFLVTVYDTVIYLLLIEDKM